MSTLLSAHRDKWKLNTETGCKIWTGATAGSRGRRPSLTIDFKKKYVARLVCEEYYGPPPDGHEVCHKPPCYNPLCVEGTHLYWGTHRQNMMDVPKEMRIAVSKLANAAKSLRVRA